MDLLKRIISWIFGLFQKSETPELDREIEQKKDNIKKFDEELNSEYNDVEEAMSEWRNDDDKLH